MRISMYIEIEFKISNWLGVPMLICTADNNNKNHQLRIPSRVSTINLVVFRYSKIMPLSYIYYIN